MNHVPESLRLVQKTHMPVHGENHAQDCRAASSRTDNEDGLVDPPDLGELTSYPEERENERIDPASPCRQRPSFKKGVAHKPGDHFGGTRPHIERIHLSNHEHQPRQL